MTDEFSPSDQLHYAIKSLPGWYYLLEVAEENFYNRFRQPVGSLVSSVLLAGGEDASPVAVSGELDDSWTGRLVAIYHDLIVIVEVTDLRGESGSFSTRVWPLTEARNLALTTPHSYYDGTDTHPRSRGFAFSFTLNETRVEMAEPTQQFISAPPETRAAAIYDAFVAIRDANTARQRS